MATGTDTGVKELMPQKSEVLPKAPALKWEKYHDDGGIFGEDEYAKLMSTEINNPKGNIKLDQFEPVHIKQAEVLAISAGLQPGDVPDTIGMYAFLREAGTTLLDIMQADTLAKNRRVQPDVPKVIGMQALLRQAALSLGEWPLENPDQVVFAESLRLTQGQEAYNQYTKQYPNIFRPQESV